MAEKIEKNADKESKNQLAKISVDELAFQNKQLQTANDALQAKVKELAESLSEINDVVEAEHRAADTQLILANMKYNVEDLEKMSLDEMRKLVSYIRNNKAPYVPVRVATDDDRENTTVPGTIFGQAPGTLLKD